LKEDSNKDDEENEEQIDWLALPVKKELPVKNDSPVKKESPKKTFGGKIPSLDDEPVGMHRNNFTVPEQAP
jgi:hypothetical protein